MRESFLLLVICEFSAKTHDRIGKPGAFQPGFFPAKKYDVKTLAKVCVAYLSSGLTVTNAVGLLDQAYFFDEPFLVQRCWKTIDTNTDEALSSPGKHSSMLYEYRLSK
ncbi:unnamed protein product [Gongylonema pulchrum]|uniref:DDE_Tnp_1_7 domain-containing protein n=1 Tax=Gongylonema pulchrum TaxID=637853 RepID=A0A183D3E3_9BILA|nr:unnamed protein product [Gongylonema pulchrum]